jgi:biopolymer transport protein ExbB/TolQ
MVDSHRPRAVAFAGRAAERAAAVVRRELRRGTAGLQAIASTAPLLGTLGTVALMVDALRAYSLPFYESCDCAGGLSETFVPLALSLPVALLASGGLHCLEQMCDSVELEIRTAIPDLLDSLARC